MEKVGTGVPTGQRECQSFADLITLLYSIKVGTASYYVQAGPAVVVAVDGVDTETQFSGKARTWTPRLRCTRSIW